MRSRANQSEMEARRVALVDIVNDVAPATVRQIFYQATVRGVVDKTERDYDKVQVMLAQLREAGRVPWGSITDSTRITYQSSAYVGPAQFLEDSIDSYKLDYWHDRPVAVEVWLEKDALSGVVSPITYEYGVPLKVARGYASLSALHLAAQHVDIRAQYDQETRIYLLGDNDPSGLDAHGSIRQKITEYSKSKAVKFRRLAVRDEQIEEWDLPSRPTKQTDSRAARFGDKDSVELDAIDPVKLRALVKKAINRHLPDVEFEALQVFEEEHRRTLRALAAKL